jgi:hypothetical protein
VIDENLVMLDMDPRQFRRLYDLAVPLRKPRRIILLHDDGHVVKALDTERGLRPDLYGSIGEPEKRAREIFDAESGIAEVLILERAAMREYFAAMQATYTPTESADEYYDRCLRARDRYPGRIVKYPPQFPGLQYLGIDWEDARAFVQRYIPPDSWLFFAAFEADRIWMSWIIGLSGGQVVRVASSDAILPLDASFPGWQTRYRELVDLCNRQLGPVSLGLFTDRDTLVPLLTSSHKGEQFLRAVKNGRIIADPIPAPLQGLTWLAGLTVK